MEKINIGFYFFEGVLIFCFWIFYLVSGQMDFQRLGWLNAFFHLFSEFFLSGVCLLTAWALLKKKSWAKMLYFFCAGLFLSSVVNAAFYYLLDPVDGDPAMAGMFGVFTLAAAGLLLMSHSKFLPGYTGRLQLWVNGVLIYIILNFVADMLRSGNYGQSLILLTSVLILGFLAYRQIKR